MGIFTNRSKDDNMFERIMKSSGLGLWNAIGSGYKRRDYDISNLPPQAQAYLNSLSPSELEILEDDYYRKDNGAANMWGIGGYDRYVLDTEALLRDLESLGTMTAEYDALGDAPIYDDYLDSARAQIDSENQEMFADLDNLLNTRTDLYNRQLSDISSGYNDMRSNLLSQQYRQNNQLMDTLQSGMDRSRRNALEAGASAGIRIAGNINTLLSVQNKQSATSMDTANQLAQMMVNQRNAENSVRSAYTDALGEDTANRHAIKLGSEGRASSLANTNYQSARSSYDSQLDALDKKYSYSGLYDKRGQASDAFSKGFEYRGDSRGRR